MRDIEKIAAHFGRKAQSIKAIEELSELIQALCKLEKGDSMDEQIHSNIHANLIEEIADVEIMLDQLKYLYYVSERQVERIKRQKIQRTMERYEIDG